nr:MAG TPA: tail tape measure [Caudoviricetes sp.]
MLEQLALSFKVIGNGLESMKKIDVQLSALKNKISTFQSKLSNFRNKIGSIFSQIKNKITSSMSGAFSRINNGLNNVRRGFKRFGNYAVQQFERSKQKANGLMGVFKKLLGMIAAGVTIKASIDGASSMEQFRNTLETVLKDPDKARKKLAWANRFANKTPFESQEVVEGMTKLQSYGIEGDRILKTTNRTYLEMIGDMASGMGKSFDQAIEAVADARTGELERLKEFGITKNMIDDFGKSQGIEIFNNKGQIKDMELFNKTLFEMMNSRFGGAMEKQAKTFKGGLSTISGAFKSGLATLAGVNEFGDIVENSPFQILKDKVIIPFSELLVKLQEDGTFTKWAENLASVFQELISWGEKIIKFIVDWKELLIPLVSALAGLFIINKVVVLIGALQTALAALSFNPVMLGIGAVIAIGVLLYRNWDLIKEKLISLWDKIKGFVKIFLFFSGIGLIIKLGQLLVKNWDLIKAKLASLWAKIKAFGKALWDIGKKIFTWLSPIGLIITIGRLIIENWDLIKAKFSELGIYLYSKILDIVNFFVSLKDKTIDIFLKLVEMLKGVWDTIKSTTSAAFDFILDYVNQIWEKIKGFFSDLGSKIKSLPGIRVFFKEEKEGEKTNIDGSHRSGLSYVPRDGYIAELHEGERVLTKEENSSYRKKSFFKGVKEKIEATFNPNFVIDNNENVIENKTGNENNNLVITNSKSTSNYKNNGKAINLTINFHIKEALKNEVDYNRIAEMIVEKFEEIELQGEIARGNI